MIEIALVIALLCFIVLAWLRFPIALGVFFFALPAYQVRFQFFGVPTTLLELLLLAMLLVALFRFRPTWQDIRNTPLFLPALLLVLIATVSVVISPDRHAGLGAFKAYFLEPILFYFVFWRQLRSHDTLRWMLIGLGSAALVTGIVALLQYVQLVPSPAPWSLESPRRMVGVFDYPNAVGLFLSAIAAFFLAIAIFNGFSRRFRYFAGIVLVACVLGIVFSVSRGAVLAVGASFIVLASFHRCRKWFFLGFVALLVLALLIPKTRTIVASVATGRDVSTDVRTVLWQGTVRLLKARPIQGAGLGGFPIVYNEYRFAKHTELLLYPHNIVFNFWVELGLAGVLVMAWLFAVPIAAAIRTVRSSAEHYSRTVTLGALAALIGMVAYGLVDVPYFKNDLALLFWLCLALIVALQPIGKENTGQKTRKTV